MPNQHHLTETQIDALIAKLRADGHKFPRPTASTTTTR